MKILSILIGILLCGCHKDENKHPKEHAEYGVIYALGGPTLPVGAKDRHNVKPDKDGKFPPETLWEISIIWENGIHENVTHHMWRPDEISLGAAYRGDEDYHPRAISLYDIPKERLKKLLIEANKIDDDSRVWNEDKINKVLSQLK